MQWRDEYIILHCKKDSIAHGLARFCMHSNEYSPLTLNGLLAKISIKSELILHYTNITKKWLNASIFSSEQRILDTVGIAEYSLTPWQSEYSIALHQQKNLQVYMLNSPNKAIEK